MNNNNEIKNSKALNDDLYSGLGELEKKFEEDWARERQNRLIWLWSMISGLGLIFLIIFFNT